MSGWEAGKVEHGVEAPLQGAERLKGSCPERSPEGVALSAAEGAALQSEPRPRRHSLFPRDYCSWDLRQGSASGRIET